MTRRRGTNIGRRQRGFSMVESLICIIIVGVMLTAALRSVGASNTAQASISNRAIGNMLAQSLIDEITAQQFENPSNPVFGPEAGENSRATYNDVDDYANLSESPPKNLDGSTMSNLSGWSRSVDVGWCDPANMNKNITTDTGIKRIYVTVTKNGQLMATRAALRVRAP
jgi:MSHA pilin protein MshD